MDVYVDSLEEMCDLMCDNKLPKKKKAKTIEKEQWFIFTFGHGHKHYGYCVKIYGTYSSARQKMFANYGEDWAFQYTLDEWGEWLKRKLFYIPEEKVLEVIK